MHDRQELIAALQQTRERMRALVDDLDDEQLDLPWHPGVNPPLWEMGHAAFFYEVFVLQQLDGGSSINPAMDELWDSFHVAHRERWSRELFPGREATLAYADQVHERILRRIREQPLEERARYLYRYAIYHQNMHIESMIWARQTLGYPTPASVLTTMPPHGGGGETGDVAVPAGRWWIGMPADSEQFGGRDFAFDNEKPGFALDLPAFSIAATPTSNRQFLAFVEDGGYRQDAFWSLGGRRWKAGGGAMNPEAQPFHHPIHWRCQDGVWQERLFDRWLPLDPNSPARHLSYWEAEAWCRWAGRRLPSEYEWEVAALGNRADAADRRAFPWGDTFDPARADMDATAMARLPVAALADSASPFGCRQMIGTLWEWTASDFLPYDGFRVDMYPFMSTLQFGDHKTTRGGSCATSSMLIRGTYRQAYLPDRNDAFTGFRSCPR